jgi:hypothetical protein
VAYLEAFGEEPHPPQVHPRIVLQNVQGVCIQPREKVAENIWVDIVERYGQSLAGATCKYSLEVGPSRLG